MKRNLIAVLLCACLLSGCINSVRLNQRGIVQAMGVDLSKTGGCRLTLQISRPGGGKESGKPLVIEEEGGSLTDALARAAVAQGKQLFLGDCRLVVFGRELVQEGADSALDYLNANSLINPSTTVLVSDGTAGEVLGLQEKDPLLDADGLLEMVQGAYHYGRAPRSRLIDLVNAAQSDHLAGALAVLHLEQGDREEPETDSQSEEEQPPESGSTDSGASAPEQGQEQPAPEPLVSGVGIFDRYRLSALLDEQETRGYGWTQKGIRGAPIVVSDEQLGQVSALTISHRVKIIPEVVGDLMVFRIQVQVKSAVQEVSFHPDMHLEEETRSYIARLQERVITEEIQAAVDASRRWGCDLFGLSLLVRQREPGFYQQNQEDWISVIQKSGYDVEVHCEVAQTGGRSL